jgi:hypothetical protein
MEDIPLCEKRPEPPGILQALENGPPGILKVWDDGPPGTARILTGLLNRVSERLEQAGYQVRITWSIYDRDRPSWDNFQGADPSTLEVLGVLENEPRGQFVASTTGSLFGTLVLLCRFFRGKIMVIAESRRDMYRLTHQLRSRIDEPVVCITKACRITETRIEVGTEPSLDLMRADVVILARANQALQAQTRTRLGSLRRQRIYGLRLVHEQVSFRSELLVEGIIGPVLTLCGPIRKEPRTVSVLLADWRCRSLSYGQFGLDWKRHAIWQNSDRNNAIAGIAQALIAGDLVALGGHGIFPDATDEAMLVKDGCSVAILVESPEHAKEIGARLPGWRVVTGQSQSDVERPELTGSSSDHAESTSETSPEEIIITQVGASRYPMSTVDVLIRAEGLRWPLEVPHLFEGRRDGKQCRLLMIDLRDDFDEIALDATRRRIADYQRRSWEVTGGLQVLETAGGE